MLQEAVPDYKPCFQPSTPMVPEIITPPQETSSRSASGVEAANQSLFLVPDASNPDTAPLA